MQSTICELKANLDSVLKENSQLKEEVYRISNELSDKDLELKMQTDKLKFKINSLKKEIKQKEKDYDCLKDNVKRDEKERVSSAEIIENFKIEIKKLKEGHESTMRKL